MFIVTVRNALARLGILTDGLVAVFYAGFCSWKPTIATTAVEHATMTGNTFTIQSVHGVKQTFVLVPTGAVGTPAHPTSSSTDIDREPSAISPKSQRPDAGSENRPTV